MRIFFVCHEFFSETKENSGGIATYMYNISKIFKENNHEVIIVVLSSESNDRIIYDGVDVERVRVPRFIKKLKKLLKGKWFENLFSAALLRMRINKLVRECKPDIIHYANFKAVGFFARKDIPSTTRISSDNVLWREAFKEDFNESSINHILLEDRLEYKALKDSTSLFCPSKLVSQITSDRIGRIVTVIESPAILSKKMDYNKYYNYAKGKKYFLYFGSFSRLKGIHYIGEALSRILELDKELYFIFIGRDNRYFGKNSNISGKEYLKNCAGEYADRVIVLPPMNREEINPFIQNCCACLFLSMYDNLPNACIETMGFSKIVVANTDASFEQLINDGKNGFLVNKGNADDLIDKLRTILSLSCDERKRIEDNAKKTLERLHPDVIYEKVLDFYKKTIDKFKENRR